jgi:hypothetical protein
MDIKASDEWLVIGGGIGIVVLLFAVYRKAKTGTAGAGAPGYVGSSVSPYSTGTGGGFPSSTPFSPAVENINIGATTLGGSTYNIGTGKPLFPLFGYAATGGSNNPFSPVYSLINKMMANNANYQAGQNANQNQFLNTAGGGGSYDQILPSMPVGTPARHSGGGFYAYPTGTPQQLYMTGGG